LISAFLVKENSVSTYRKKNAQITKYFIIENFTRKVQYIAIAMKLAISFYSTAATLLLTCTPLEGKSLSHVSEVKGNQRCTTIQNKYKEFLHGSMWKVKMVAPAMKCCPDPDGSMKIILQRIDEECLSNSSSVWSSSSKSSTESKPAATPTRVIHAPGGPIESCDPGIKGTEGRRPSSASLLQYMDLDSSRY
jgi:hypothetical protein